MFVINCLHNHKIFINLSHKYFIETVIIKTEFLSHYGEVNPVLPLLRNLEGAPTESPILLTNLRNFETYFSQNIFILWVCSIDGNVSSIGKTGKSNQNSST